MLAYLFVLIAVAVRMLAGTGYLSTMGFVPLEASLLFFGSRMPRKQFLIPLTLLIGCDLYLTLVKYQTHITMDQALIWAWYLAPCFIGVLLKDRAKPLYIAGAALGSATSFFLVSNFGVWLAGYVGYPKTLAGLATCYVSAIPFYEKGMVSNLLFSAVFFSVPALIALTRGVLPERADKDAAA
jgi:hypothetical protein